MSEVSKPEKYEQEQRIFALRNEQGLNSMYQWLKGHQAEINAKWPTMVGDDLIKLQGVAHLAAKLVRMIEQGPTIKSTPEVKP